MYKKHSWSIWSKTLIETRRRRHFSTSLHQKNLLKNHCSVYHIRFKICGDIHRQFKKLLHIFQLCRQQETKEKCLFLGKFVVCVFAWRFEVNLHQKYCYMFGQGPQCLETVLSLFLQKCHYKDTFFLLRGNCKTAGINWNYGFYDEIMKRYGDNLILQAFQVWYCFTIRSFELNKSRSVVVVIVLECF